MYFRIFSINNTSFDKINNHRSYSKEEIIIEYAMCWQNILEGKYPRKYQTTRRQPCSKVDIRMARVMSCVCHRTKLNRFPVYNTNMTLLN